MALLLLSPWYIYFTKLNNNRIDYTLFGTSKQSGSRGVASNGFNLEVGGKINGCSIQGKN
jgi:hypothetical protein